MKTTYMTSGFFSAKLLMMKIMLVVGMMVSGVNLLWGQTTDVLNRALTGVSGTSYTNWSGKTSNSDAVYAGQSAGGNNSIQLRTKNSNSGIITTVSGGSITKVIVTWNSSTASGRTLNIYGKNTAYTSPTELYNASTQGTLLGTIVYGTSTELSITGDYTYIGLRSASDAMYITEIQIIWNIASSTYSVTYNSNGATSGSAPTDNTSYSSGATVIVKGNGSLAKTGHTFSGWNTVANGSGSSYSAGNTFSITSNTTLYAQWTPNQYTVEWFVNGSSLQRSQHNYGTTIDVPSVSVDACYDKVFVGWTENSSYSDDDAPTDLFNNTRYTITDAEDKAFYAVFAEASGEEEEYIKVTSSQLDWTGKYLIAYNNGIFMDGALAGGTGAGAIGANGASINPGDNLVGNTINTTWGDAHCLEVVSVDGGYVMKTLTGDYIYQTSNANGLATTPNLSTADDHPLAFSFVNENNIEISIANLDPTPLLHYNTQSSGYFRFYNNGTQNPIYMYKRSGNVTYSAYSTSCAPPTEATIYYYPNGGIGSPVSQTVNIGAGVIISENEFTAPTGYHFLEWNTSINGLGTSYMPGDTYESLMSNVRLYAIWEKNIYNVEWYVNGDMVQSESYIYNSPILEITVPEDPEISACDDSKVFIGWTTTEIVTEQNTRPSVLYSYDDLSGMRVTDNITFYAVFASIGAGVNNEYRLYSGALTEGDYIIYYGGKAMNMTVSNAPALQYTVVSPTSDDIIANPSANIIWHIAQNGEYWTIYNATAGKYAASNGANYKSQLLDDGNDNKSKWMVVGSSTYDFINVQNTINDVMSNLRYDVYNGNIVGFVCCSEAGPLSLYKYYTYTGYVTTCTPPSCSMPMSLNVDNVTSSSANISWTARNGESQWEYYYSTSNIAPTTATGTISENTFEITGLTENTVYYWWVRAKCDENYYSVWAYGGSFLTGSSANATILESGDLAIVAINNKLYSVSGNSADEFSFMFFKDISSGTAIDLTDNGYEKKYQGYWGTEEGFWRFTRKNNSLSAGSIMTISETRGRIGMGVEPVIGTNINIYLNGSLDNDDWDVVAYGPLDLNAEDQIWVMQGGSWVVSRADKAKYTGNVLYGYTATGWEPEYGYNATHGSTIYPSCDCFVSSLNIGSGISKYKGPFSEVTKREWIMRINDGLNWGEEGEYTTSNYTSTSPTYRTWPTSVLSIAPGDFTQGKWGGKKDSNWCNCANWMSLVVPDETVDVEIPDIGINHRIAVHTGDTARCKTLTIKGDGFFTATRDTSTLLVAGDIIIEDGGTFQPAENNKFEIILGGNIERVGTFETNSSTSLTLVGELAQNIPAPTSGGNLMLRNLTVTSASNTFAVDTIELYGNLNDNSSSHTGFNLPQSVTFTGDDEQTSTATTLTNVTMNKSVNNLSLSDTLIVNNKCKFVKGNIIGNVTFAEFAQSEGASTNSYIDGTVTKIASASDFSFPTGSNGVLGQMDVTSLSSNTSLNFHFKEGGFSASEMPVWWNQNNMCNDNGTNEKFDHVSNMYFWNLGTSSTIEGASFSVSASDDVHFNDTIINQRDASVIKMAIYDGCWKNIGGTASAPSPYNQVSMSNINLGATRAAVGEKTLSFGSVDENTILPIELTSFTATCNGKSANLAWTTASERNNDYFVVERSHDAINFTEIARVAGAGNSIEQQDYNYIDYIAAEGDNYYRLVQVDYDGTRTASEIVVANCYESDGESDVHVFPNPFHNDVTIHIENLGGSTVSIEVYDMLGKLVHQKTVSVGNENEITLNLQNLPNGAYNIRVSASDYVFNKQVIKQ